MDTLNKNLICDNITSTPQNVVVVSHTSPDGDAIGSALAMNFVLKFYGHNSTVIFPDAYPDYYSWLPGIDDVIIAENNFDKAVETIKNATMQVIVDMNHLKRAANIGRVLAEANAKRILIDHHILDKSNFDAIYSTPNVSSTCELVYDIIEHLDSKILNKDIAACIYTGIVTDTGNFFHGNMSHRTFQITAELILQGINILKINQMLYHNFSENRIRLLGFCLNNRLNLIHEHNAAYIYLTKEDLERFEYSEGDSEDIVNYGLTIKGISLSVFFIEKPKFIKISFRSEGDIDVNYLAKKYFNGGGHKNASGAHFHGSIEEAINTLKKCLLEI